MMDAHLPQILRGLCLNTEWNYAVFWKLKHHPQMVLTWEDAYYHNCGKRDLCGSECNGSLQSSLHEGCSSHDPLHFAMARMSSQAYPVGKGIIGQVALTGKHQWILAGQHAENSLPSSEHCDEWKAQFLAGIQTIVVAAVLPHGVLQLGSLNEVPEEIKQVSHLRDVFSAIYDLSTSPISSPMLRSQQNSMNMPDISVNPEILQGCPINLCKSVNGEKLCPPFPKLGENLQGASIPSDIAGALPLSEPVPSISEDVESPDSVHLSYLKQEFKELVYEQSCKRNRAMSYDVTLGANKSNAGCTNPPSDLLVSSVYNRCDSIYNRPSTKALLNAEEEFQRDVGRITTIKPEQDCLDTLVSSFNLSSGYELDEALRTNFSKQNYPCWWDMEDSQLLTASELADGKEHSMLTSDAGSDHLLEAVVANYCNKESTSNGRKSYFASADSSLITEKMMSEASSITDDTIGSASYSIDCSSLLQESSHLCRKSLGSFNVKSVKAFSSQSPSMSKGQLLRPHEHLKVTKKRSKPGENLRPRPRDRQLIQDRIKELRELVPNGAKCSIDSLLERTIKHMCFLQSVTKHSDKLGKCIRSKNKGGLGGSSCDQGASWAVEVGGHMKICPIVVENLNLNGQLLIEMSCEQCDHFLEVGEAIKGLGLTILKGATEKHGDRTWMQFVVEGESNRSMHRLDVLWSLVQILQTKSTT